MTLLDKYPPVHDFPERHATDIDVPASQVMAAMQACRPEATA